MYNFVRKTGTGFMSLLMSTVPSYEENIHRSELLYKLKNNIYDFSRRCRDTRNSL